MALGLPLLGRRRDGGFLLQPCFRHRRRFRRSRLLALAPAAVATVVAAVATALALGLPLTVVAVFDVALPLVESLVLRKRL